MEPKITQVNKKKNVGTIYRLEFALSAGICPNCPAADLNPSIKPLEQPHLLNNTYYRNWSESLNSKKFN